MKILHLFFCYGAFIINHIEEERNQGLDAEGLFYSLTKGQLGNRDLPHVIQLDAKSHIRGNFSLSYRIQRAYPAIRDVVKKENPDVIYASISGVDGRMALRLKKELGIPYITAVRKTDIHGVNWKSETNRQRMSEILKNADMVYTLCPDYEEKLQQRLPADIFAQVKAKLYFTSNGIGSFWRENFENKEKTADKSEIKVVTVGDICHNKGQVYIARALESLRKTGVRTSYTVIGRTVDRDVVKELASYGDIRILPFAKPEELIRIYDEADIMALVSQQETFGIVYPEAMSRGLPIVYTRGEGFSGRYADGVIGCSADFGDIGDIQKAIGTILENYSAISKRCLEETSKFFWSNIVNRYCAEYKEALSAGADL